MFLKALLLASVAVLLVSSTCVQEDCPFVPGTEEALTLLPDIYNCSQYISCFRGEGTIR